jgi:hypothetical protein
MSSTALAHTKNSSGVFGTFVDTSGCPCGTCLAERSAPEEESSSSLGPAPTPISGISEAQVRLYSSLGAGTGLVFTGGLGRSSAVYNVPMGGLGPAPTDEEQPVMDALRKLRATLQIRQDAVYTEEAGSHSDQALQDQEFEELDRKIQAIENCLIAFGSFFRTR